MLCCMVGKLYSCARTLHRGSPDRFLHHVNDSFDFCQLILALQGDKFPKTSLGLREKLFGLRADRSVKEPLMEEDVWKTLAGKILAIKMCHSRQASMFHGRQEPVFDVRASRQSGGAEPAQLWRLGQRPKVLTGKPYKHHLSEAVCSIVYRKAPVCSSKTQGKKHHRKSDIASSESRFWCVSKHLCRLTLITKEPRYPKQ